MNAEFIKYLLKIVSWIVICSLLKYFNKMEIMLLLVVFTIKVHNNKVMKILENNKLKQFKKL